MRRAAIVVLVAIAAVVAVLVLHRSNAERPGRRSGRAGSATVVASPVDSADARRRLDAIADSLHADAISPIANDLNAPSGSVRHDLEILNAVFEAWRTNFSGQGNPVGENDEITLALAGNNALKFAFISPRHPAIDPSGRLCDRWGTPYRFHQLSGTDMEIWSAGPDRRFGTADDARYTPSAGTAVAR